MKDIFEQVEKNIDHLVENNADWTASATKKQINDARQGNLTLKFFEKEVPKEWLADIRGKKVLCLAGQEDYKHLFLRVQELMLELQFMTRAIKN